MATASASARPRVLAVASGGGHWVQLRRLWPAFEACDLAVVTVSSAYGAQAHGARFYVVNDATRWNKWAVLIMALRMARVLLVERPDVVVSTGAAPGYVAVRLGKWLGARTVWIDSIANVERLSASGQRAGACSDLWLTQWPHLAAAGGPRYEGGIL